MLQCLLYSQVASHSSCGVMRWCVRNEERRGEERERTLSLGWPPHCSSSFGFHSLFSSLLCAPLSCFPVPPLSSPSLCSLFSIVILSQPQTQHCCVVSCRVALTHVNLASRFVRAATTCGKCSRRCAQPTRSVRTLWSCDRCVRTAWCSPLTPTRRR